MWVGLLILRPRLISLNSRQIFISLGLGVFGYTVFSTFYFKAIESVSVPLAALLLFTYPIFVNFGSHFVLKERIRRSEFFSLACACVGLGLLLWGPLVVQSNLGVLYGLGSAMAYSVYVLVSGKLQKNVPPLSSGLYVMTATAGAQFLVHRPDLQRIFEFTTLQISCILAIAFVCTIAPLSLFLAGLQKLSSSQASIVAMIEPAVAALAAWAFLNETLSSLQGVGGGIVLAALIFNMVNFDR